MIGMKTVSLFVHQREISRIFSYGFQLTLKDDASLIDAIKAVDEEIIKKMGKFPVEK
jgi:hypothetical protein